MICPKCGRTIPDGTQCPCGAPVLSSNPAVNVIKTVGSSSKFLAVAVLYSVGILCSLLATFSASSMMEQIYYEMYYYGANFGLNPDVFYPMMNALESSSVVGAVLSAIPTILIALGMWLFYSSCRNTQSGNVATVGLTICKVIAYIGLVMVCLAAAIIAICLVAVIVAVGSLAGGSYYGGYGDASAIAVVQVVLGVFTVLFLAVIALVIVFYVCMIKVINRIKTSAIQGVADNRIPHFLTGYLMVMGILAALGGVIALITSPIAGIGSLVGAASMIIMSLVLGEYRTRMTMLLFPPVQPMYGNMPPYNNNPPQQPGGPTDGYPQQ